MKIELVNNTIFKDISLLPMGHIVYQPMWDSETLYFVTGMSTVEFLVCITTGHIKGITEFSADEYPFHDLGKLKITP